MTEQTALVYFEPANIAKFGNEALRFVLTHEMRKELAEQELKEAQNRERAIDAEFVRVAMYLHNEGEIDLFKAYGNKKDTAHLYNGILISLGILRKAIVDDQVVMQFTDPDLEDAYSFKQAVASYKQGEDEETPRYAPEQIAAEKVKRSRRNSLNIRLQRVAKAALELIEAKASPDDIKTVEKENGDVSIVLTKGPKTVMGKEKEVEIASGNVAKVEGATFTPTITGLAKAADARHKEEPNSKQKTESAQPSVNTANEQNFLALVNAVTMAVAKREGTFTDPEKQAMKNLLTSLEKEVKK